MSNADGLFLGIDGGGTSCRARLCDGQGSCLGEGQAGSANIGLGVDLAYAAVLSATRQALQAAGLSETVLGRVRAGLGLAGVVSESRRAAVRAHPHPFAEVVVGSDAEAACLGAHGGGEGAILILGTGSCGVARVDGCFHTLGGWGFPISDQGSGAWLGLNLVRYALQAEEAIVAPTPLSQALMARFAHSPAAVLDWAEAARPRDYAALVPLILEQAQQDDPLGQQLLQQAAAEAELLLRRLHQLGAGRICLMGGLSSVLASRLSPACQGWLTKPRGDALDGALLLAGCRTRGRGAGEVRDA